MRSAAERSSFISGLAGAASESADSMAVSVMDKSTWGDAAGAACGFETVIICVHTRHLKRAAVPFILEGSILYFFPHSSQITIMAELLYDKFSNKLADMAISHVDIKMDSISQAGK
jgi:hypothetical protein